METGVTVAEVAELLLAARGRIDFYWNFHVAVVVAVIGWTVSLRKTLSPSLKLLVSAAYAIAAGANLAGLYSAYTFAEALRVDLLRLAADSPSLTRVRSCSSIPACDNGSRPPGRTSGLPQWSCSPCGSPGRRTTSLMRHKDSVCPSPAGGAPDTEIATKGKGDRSD